jgi:hypothetical protein
MTANYLLTDICHMKAHATSAHADANLSACKASDAGLDAQGTHFDLNNDL